MLPLLALVGGYRVKALIFGSPLFFGVAHAHHGLQRIREGMPVRPTPPSCPVNYSPRTSADIRNVAIPLSPFLLPPPGASGHAVVSCQPSPAHLYQCVWVDRLFPLPTDWPVLALLPRSCIL